ncbi:MAG: 30S ribosomal protein S1 [Rickettsiales bacterium]|jgi:small subunit ribosomal protein S1|nr:30S ribosomal protein S1 [Rickettsiales bacterium]
MKDLSKGIFNPLAGENFGDLFNAAYGSQETLQGYATKGNVKDIIGDFVLVDVGLKSEGRVLLKEFGATPPKVGDIVDVFVERYESREGTAMLSYTKARAEKAWKELEKLVAEGVDPTGTIVDAVRGGYTVDIGGIFAFMPSSQADARPIRDAKSLIGMTDKFRVLKMDALRTNAIVSRRAIQDAGALEAQKEILKNLSVGTIVEGVIKNITDYGAFIDLGGIDGLLHVTDISWKRVSNPKEVLRVGEKVKVKIIQFDHETHRISLGMKQLEANPWDAAAKSFNVGDVVEGKVCSLTDYGAFIDLGNDIEGLAHMSEISWTNKNQNPNKILSVGQVVNVKILNIDNDKHRISLGIKQNLENPWKAYSDKHKVGDVISGAIKNITEFGLFIALNDELDGMVHVSDVAWSKSESDMKNFERGQVVNAKILDINIEKERITLGIKQLDESGASAARPSGGMNKGDVVKGKITEVNPEGITIELPGGKIGTIRKTDVSRDKALQSTAKYKVGDELEAMVAIPGDKEVKLSVRALDEAQEKKAVREYSNQGDSGAVLGDILSAAIEKQNK